VVFSLGVGVKMVVLLAVPAVGAVVWQAVGREGAVGWAGGMGVVQVSFFFSSFFLFLAGFFEFGRFSLHPWGISVMEKNYRLG
jgi:alpha-1,3-mannosyltransferase